MTSECLDDFRSISLIFRGNGSIVCLGEYLSIDEGNPYYAASI